MMISLVLAALLLPSAVMAECGPTEKSETVIGRLENHNEDARRYLTPYTIISQGVVYALYPDGPYFGTEWGDEGFEEIADRMLIGFENHQVKITGCTSPPTSNGRAHHLSGITNIEAV